jgi:hypothetical protein
VIIVALPILAAGLPGILAVSLVLVVLVGFGSVVARRVSPAAAVGHNWLPLATRLLTLGAVILSIAVGVKALQLGRVEVFAQDLVAQSPFHSRPTAVSPVPAGAPSMVFILLDGYPRADQLQSEFGIDNSAFVTALRARDFVVADHSRSNENATELTLAQMLGGLSAGDIARRPRSSTPPSRVDINDSALLGDLEGLGYQTIAVSPGFEQVALRRADVFIDTGQLNRVRDGSHVADGAVDACRCRPPEPGGRPGPVPDPGRVQGGGGAGAEPRAGRKFLFVHVASPHPPLVFDASGGPLEVPSSVLSRSDPGEIALYGLDGHAKRLGGEI